MVSPHHQSANGKAERAVQIIKRLWSKCDDKYMALLDYNTTTMESLKASPAQLLMGRRLRSLLPSHKQLLKPTTIPREQTSRHYYKEKKRQKWYHDRRTRTLKPLSKDCHIRLSPKPGYKNWSAGRVIERFQPRTYRVESDGAIYRRNRKDLRMATEEANRMTRCDLPKEPFEHTQVLPSQHANTEINAPSKPHAMYERTDSQPETVSNELAFTNERVEVPSSSTRGEFSNSSNSIKDPLSLRHQPDNATYITMRGRVVKKPDKYTL